MSITENKEIYARALYWRSVDILDQMDEDGVETLA
jgi:hypothetical protein